MPVIFTGGYVWNLTGFVAVDTCPCHAAVITSLHVGSDLRLVGVVHRVAVVTYEVDLLTGTCQLVEVEVHDGGTFAGCIDAKHIAMLRARHTLEFLTRVLGRRTGRSDELIDKGVLTLTRHLGAVHTSVGGNDGQRIMVTQLREVPRERLVVSHYVRCTRCGPVLHIQAIDDIIVALDFLFGDDVAA